MPVQKTSGNILNAPHTFYVFSYLKKEKHKDAYLNYSKIDLVSHPAHVERLDECIQLV